MKKNELEKSLNFLNSILDSASHGVISTDIDGTITSFNKKAEQMLNYSAKELIGKQNPGIFHDIEQVISRTEEFNKKLNINIEPGFKTFVCHCDLNLKNEFEWTYVRKDGSKLPVLLSITAIKDENGITTGYLGLARDISEQKRLEEDLAQKHSDLEVAQSIAHIGSWSFSLKNGKIEWSKEMYNIFPEKVEDGEPEFEKHKSTIHPDDVIYWEAVVQKCIEDGKPYIMLFRTHKIDNKKETVWVEARGQGIFHNGEIIGLAGTCQNVTERVLKLEKIEEHSRKAQIAEKAKADFLANMSHEIRTPMNGIIGMLELLNETQLDSEQQEMLDTISQSSQSLLTLLSDILDISKIEAGKMSLEKINFDLNHLLHSVVRLMDFRAKETGNKLLLSLPVKNDIWLKGDQTRIRQILMNYISNAIKFTENGKIEIGYKISSDNNIIFHVKDNGIGISKGDQEKLFQAFSQADTSITRRFGGTGLGLIICSQLAEIMDGKVYFESKKGQGSTFYLELKLEEGAPIERSKVIESKHKLIPKKNAKILIVEDNQINQKVATKTLEKLGYHSEIADNGKIALELIQKNGIDYFSLILMDLQMPVMDGLTATKEIQKRYPDAPPVIALTANAFSSDKQSCLNAGMKDYLSKPLKKDYLEKVLLQYIK